MTKRLAVLLGGDRVGTLTQDRRTQFTYDPAYLTRRTPTPLSLAMPPRPDPYPQAQTLPWADGLLPDRLDVRQRWAEQFGVSARNPFALLAEMGRDCPGAVQISPEDDVEDVTAGRGELRPLTDRQIGQRLTDLRRDTDSWTVPGERWSLGGAQAKFAAAEHDGGWYEAHGAVPTTHILKPGVAGYASQGLNEHISMTAARLLGIRVAATRYLEFAGQPAIVVTRYDRLTRDGDVTRIHQEDLCQALSCPAHKKYETDRGPGTAAISDLLRGRGDPDSNWRFVEAVAFNYLLGNPDAHAKNYSVLLAGNQVRLAPLYDLASALPYDPRTDDSDLHKTAMAIGGQRRFGAVTAHNWERLARRTGTDPDRLTQRVRHLANDLPDALNDALNTVPATNQRDQLRRRLLDRLTDHLHHITDQPAATEPPTPSPKRSQPATDTRPVHVRQHQRNGRIVHEFWRAPPTRQSS